MAHAKVDGQAGKGSKHTSVDFCEFIHDPLEFGFEANRKEMLVAKYQQGPHEHRVIEPDRRGGAFRGSVTPFGRVVLPIALIDHLFAPKVAIHDHVPTGKVPLRQRAKTQHLFIAPESLGGFFLLPVVAIEQLQGEHAAEAGVV